MKCWCFACRASHLEGSSFQQADLVVLGEVTEARDPLGEVDHLLHGWGEAHGKLLPDLLTGLARIHVGRCVHWTDLEKREGTGSIRDGNLKPNVWQVQQNSSSDEINETLTKCALLVAQLVRPL